MTITPSWKLRGICFIACNCDYGCPCNFNAQPTKGKCEGGWTWHVEQGTFDGVRMDGVTFGVYVNWPGAIHHGHGEGFILVDERADARQRAAVATLVGGTVGGPWGVLGWTWPKIHGPVAVRYEIEANGLASRVKAGDLLELEMGAIKNPVNGAEVHPGVVLPEGLIVKKADIGCSRVFRTGEPVRMDHSGQYAAIGAFEYASAN